jgi:hypothetical protein
MKLGTVLLAACAMMSLFGPGSGRAATFTITAEASPAQIQPGQTEQITGAATTKVNLIYPKLVFVFAVNGVTAVSNTLTNVRIGPRLPVAQTIAWPLAATATPGAYSVSFRVQNATGSVIYATATTGFSVASASGANAPAPVNGACGAANGVAASTAPSAGLCGAGSASAVSGSGRWTWSCSGSNGGATAACSAPLAQAQPVVNGACGSANGGGFTAAPTASLCNTGTASGVSGSGPWSWSCAGSGGGSTALCAASVAVNGACGSANGVAASSAPSSGLCSAGAASAVAGSGPWTWSCAGAGGGASASCAAPAAPSPQKPGPSAQLFDNPYYTCATNYYVATTGNDSNNGKSPATPWLTLQHANNSLPTGGTAAGSCINVAPGTYPQGVSITAGGNHASSSGYVVYRCTTMDACTVTDVSAGGQNGSFVLVTPGVNYVWIDGFTLSAASPTLYGQGVELFNPTSGFNFSSHHIWVTDNIVSGYGQTGIQMNNGEYFYIVHNKVYQNANVGCSAQGSGISVTVPIAAAGYTPTADDGSNQVVGNVDNTAHIFIEWNVAFNNATTGCGTASNPYDTDGNNIILDTWDWTGITGGTPYRGGGLVAFNIIYNAGGGGIAITNSSSGIIIANNSCYNNRLDPYNNGSARACIGSLGSTLINNIAVAVPAARSSCEFNTAPYAMFNNAIVGSENSLNIASTYVNNISQLQGGFSSCQGSFGEDPPTGEYAMYNGDSYSCTLNHCATNPDWVNVGGTSVGTETTPPVGANFALQASSPAIGYGLPEPYLSPQSVDVGACYHTLASCP